MTNDKFMPFLQTSKDELVWKIATPAPNIRFIDLTQENLLDAIMEVVNG